jgi:hypothetical protein
LTYRPEDAPPDGGSHRQAELPATGDASYYDPAVTHRDLSTTENRRSARAEPARIIAAQRMQIWSLCIAVLARHESASFVRMLVMSPIEWRATRR